MNRERIMEIEAELRILRRHSQSIERRIAELEEIIAAFGRAATL